MNNNNFSQQSQGGFIKILGTIVGALLIFIVGVYAGFENRPIAQKINGLLNKDSAIAQAQEVDFAPFWKAWQLANEKFPGAENTTVNDRMYGAIKGMLASFNDPYTTFFNPKETTEFETEIAGSFSGIGIEIGEKDNVLTVIAPLKNTPAYKAGILSGDKIVKIEDTITAGLSIDKAIDLIRGPEGTTVTLTVIREGSTTPKVFSITRSTITIPTVDTQIKDGVFVISLYNFSAQSVTQFKKAFSEYLDSGSTKLVIDLRGNPGGYLDAAVKIASMFIPEGDTVVREVGKTDKDIVLQKSAGPVVFPKGHKLVVLVDKGSASASEILAGALSEHNIGLLVGTQTYGKGSVQEVVPVTADTAMKVTIAKWYTPNGISISDHGLLPKVIIERDREATTDVQLQGAINLIK